MNKYIIVLFFIFYSCNKSEILIDEGYDIIVIAGQSNTLSGEWYDEVIDSSLFQIKQLGRIDSNNLKIIVANEPLENHTVRQNKIGFGLVFAKEYLKHNLTKKILIIPCGHGSTGFINNRWNKGDDLYNDLVMRVNYIFNEFPRSNLKVILWHQGEHDAINNNLNYEYSLDKFINDLRTDLSDNSIPFILGGMVPYWVDKQSNRINFQNIISETPFRIDNTAYANPLLPFKIDKTINNHDTVHFNSIGQREMGRRYFKEYLNLIQ
tara:strand:- start:544 stop:1338 length:795 start_codon:yes stop_codon:yes gene_type:complete